MASLQNNSRLSVTVSNVLLQGAGESDFFDVEPMGESTMVVGVDGKGSYVLTANRGVKISITLQSGSASNDHMQNELAKQQAGTGYLPSVFVRDGSGKLEANAPDCIITKAPNGKRGKDATENVWVLMAVDGGLRQGGNE